MLLNSIMFPINSLRGVGNNWNGIFNRLLFLSPLCVPRGAYSGLCPWPEVGRGLWSEFLGCKGPFKARRVGLCWKSSVAFLIVFFCFFVFLFLTNGHSESGSWLLPSPSGGFQTAYRQLSGHLSQWVGLSGMHFYGSTLFLVYSLCLHIYFLVLSYLYFILPFNFMCYAVLYPTFVFGTNLKKSNSIL